MSCSVLTGRRIVVTRPADQAGTMCQLLRQQGAVPVRFPVIRICPLEDTRPLKAALARLKDYDWVVFTSVNGVRIVLSEVRGQWPNSLKVAAIGPATCHALQMQGLRVDYMPSEYRAERISDGIDQGRVLLLRAQGARPALRQILRARGLHAKEVSVYYAANVQPPAAAFDALQAGVDAVTFTSGSTVHSYAQLCGNRTWGAAVVCIGPVTASAASALGFTVHGVAAEYTIDGVIESLKGLYATR